MQQGLGPTRGLEMCAYIHTPNTNRESGKLQRRLKMEYGGEQEVLAEASKDVLEDVLAGTSKDILTMMGTECVSNI